MSTRSNSIYQRITNLDLGQRISNLDLGLGRIGWYGIVTPKVFLLATVMLLPFFGAIFISLHQWSLTASTQQFIGLQNYFRLFNDPIFWIALRNTTVYSVALIVIDIPLALFIAILLNSRLKGSRFYSAAIFLPVVTSWVVVSLIWTWLYNPSYGLLNMIFATFGLPQLEWTQSTTTALPSIILMSVWKHVGFNMVIFLAGLQAIPDQYYEASLIDGANRFQQFRYITLPLLKSTSFFIVITTLASAFRVFTQMFVMTRGGPVNATTSLVLYFYRKGFQEFEFGYANALAVVMFTVVFALSIAQQQTWGQDVEY
jgi:ABC-type sugar transport system permease subunit